jgi:hypothetical protein
MKEIEKIDAIQMTRAIRDELYKSYQANPEEYFRRLHERFLKLQKEFGKRA